MLQQLTFYTQQSIRATSVQDLDPRSCANNDHASVLAHEMEVIEPGEIPSRTLTWKPLSFLNHINLRTNDNRFSVSEWESFFWSRKLIGPAQQCACNAFTYDTFRDHLQTCQSKSVVSLVHDWVVYELGALPCSVGHRIKIYRITTTTGNERGDIETKDYVVLQKPQAQDNRFPPPRTLIMNLISR